MDWRFQEERILDHLKRFFPARRWWTRPAWGVPSLRRCATAIAGTPKRFHSPRRAAPEILVGLQRASLAREQLHIAHEPTLIGELHAFTLLNERESGPAQRSKMGAPSGMHDDCVMALALAWWGLMKRGLWVTSSWRNWAQEYGFFAQAQGWNAVEPRASFNSFGAPEPCPLQLQW